MSRVRVPSLTPNEGHGIGGAVSRWPQQYPPDPRAPATYVYLPPSHRSSTAHLVCAWLAAVLSAGYMLPWAIGATRNKTNCVATALVNFFFGWSLIGWVIALVMACGSEPRQPVVVQTFPQPPYVPGSNPYGTAGFGPTAQAGYPSYPTYPTYPAHPAAPPPAALPPAQPSAAEVTMPMPTYPPNLGDPRPR
jgi:hypothetical protein